MSIEKYRFVHGRIDNEAIKEIVNSYNNTTHSTTKKTPFDILKDNTNIKKLYINKLKEYTKEKPISGAVRILINNGLFKKYKDNWSLEIYHIKKFVVEKNRYELEEFPNRYFERYELQPIDEENLMNIVKFVS